MLKVKKLSPNAQLPTKAHEDDAGFDLYASEDTCISKNGVVSTGIAVGIEKGYYGRVASRSGLSFKHDIEVGAGVIDSSYIGEIKVKLYRHTYDDSYMIIKKGDRIAQLIITPCASPKIAEVSELDETSRGDSGFGSTGK